MPSKGPGGSRSGLGGIPTACLGGATVIADVNDTTPLVVDGLTAMPGQYMSWDASNGQIIIQVGGLYTVLVGGSFSSSATCDLNAEIYVNDSPMLVVTAGFDRNISIQASLGSAPAGGTLTLAQGDVVDIRLVRDSGSDVDITFSYLYFWMQSQSAVIAPVYLHNSNPDLQGGAAGEYFHFEEAEHDTLAGLITGDDALAQYALLAGRSGGQTLYGGTAASDDLWLRSTSDATKGLIRFGVNSAYNELNERLGLGTLAPVDDLHIVGSGISAIWSSVVASSTNVGSAPGNPLTMQNLDATAGNYAGIALYDANSFYHGLFGMKYGAHSGNFQGKFFIEPMAVANPSTFVIEPTGFIGMGIVTPTQKLHVVGNAIITGAYTNTTANAANMYVDAAGLLYRSTSGRKYKKNERLVDFEPASVLDLVLKSYESIADNDDTHFGFVAEDAAEKCPQLVIYAPVYEEVGTDHMNPAFNDGYTGDGLLTPIVEMEAGESRDTEYVLENGVWMIRPIEIEVLKGWNLKEKTGDEPDAVDYAKVGALLIPVVKNQRKRIKDLEEALEAQKNLITGLSERLGVLENG